MKWEITLSHKETQTLGLNSSMGRTTRDMTEESILHIEISVPEGKNISEQEITEACKPLQQLLLKPRKGE